MSSHLMSNYPMSLPPPGYVTLIMSLEPLCTTSTSNNGKIKIDNHAFSSRANILGFKSILSKCPWALRMTERVSPNRITSTGRSMVKPLCTATPPPSFTTQSWFLTPHSGTSLAHPSLLPDLPHPTLESNRKNS